MKETQQRGGAGLVLAGASLWGLIGLFNRALLGAGLGPESIVLVRNLGGLVVLALVLAVWKREAFRVQGKHLGWFFGTGVVSVVFFTWCYFSCQEQCALAVAALVGVLVFHETMDVSTALGVMSILAAVVLLRE